MRGTEQEPHHATSINLLYPVSEAALQVNRTEKQIRKALESGELQLSEIDLPRRELVTGKSLMAFERRLDREDPEKRITSNERFTESVAWPAADTTTAPRSTGSPVIVEY